MGDNYRNGDLLCGCQLQKWGSLVWVTITEMGISCVGDNYRNGDLVWVTITEMGSSCM